jgi:hypothetical protein
MNCGINRREQEVKDAHAHLLWSDAKYRFAIDMPSLESE